MSVRWILDGYLLERSTPENGVGFPEAIRLSGHHANVHHYNPLIRSIVDLHANNPHNGPVIVYGSFQFVRAALSVLGKAVTPGSYMMLENLKFHVFAGHLGKYLLNSDFVMMPFGELLRRSSPSVPVFIRPNNVTKSFTGFSVTPEKFGFEMECLKTQLSVAADELVVMASAKPIEIECRYIIADGLVVAKSTYGWDEAVSPTANTPTECDRLAEVIARHPWQPDSVYTCDIALSEGVAKLVELNSFSCSGLYACDTVKIAQAVSDCAIKEFGDI